MTRSAKSPRIDVEALKRERPLADVISSYGVTLRREGAGTFRALCPFHQEHTPSFWIDARDSNNEHYWCFGNCGAHGDVVTFVMDREGCSFQEACERLSTRGRPPVVEPERRGGGRTLHRTPLGSDGTRLPRGQDSGTRCTCLRGAAVAESTGCCIPANQSGPRGRRARSAARVCGRPHLAAAPPPDRVVRWHHNRPGSRSDSRTDRGATRRTRRRSSSSRVLCRSPHHSRVTRMATRSGVSAVQSKSPSRATPPVDPENRCGAPDQSTWRCPAKSRS